MRESSAAYLFKSLVDALRDFYDHESQLIELEVSERALTHKLAEHLQKRFREYKVDCEYNKIGKAPKRVLNLITQMSLSGKCNADCDACSNNKCVIFPDIIVHRRGEDDNLLVVEAKTGWSKQDQSNDHDKLKALSQSREFKYKLGISLIFAENCAKAIEGFQVFCHDKSVKDELIITKACSGDFVVMP